ncbi:MAG: ABC transporter ATP-binding protein [Xanthomonadales bacterium]|nr:ABC transporter ATP-binding protein [Gammaproteobacteria bacterium]MBT8074139.1 ABC transporter ATP-binding protein [Gammaproteobacteria bacterium]NNK04992.1 ABC transporter ATP-binding protein [Xanthomonadales bacterium]NNK97915.1 ABC transporter ATP-binding protein [Xanthomonadales bacterium]
MDSLVRMEGVSKIYPRVHKPRERLQAFGSLLLGRKPAHGAKVLSDIHLDVVRGQSLGIIGENGAGKSTLLKVLTGVIQPTHGRVMVHANIAAMLELGAGFQPDFSGMENVRMKASLMGLSNKELDARLDEILDFADIGEYIHEPVKHYSSGMVVRLGFAVITACRPDLLITDEVLAVGDESFQKKCIRWIEQFLKNGGTLLLVSHSMYVVQKLCQKALWIHDGKVAEFGDVFPVTQAYLAWHEKRQAKEKEQRVRATGEGSYYRIEQFQLLEQQGDETPSFAMGDSLDIELQIYSPDDRPPVGVVGIVRADGTPVYGVVSDNENIQPVKLADNQYRFRLRFTDIRLLPGSYNLSGHSMDPEGVRVFDMQQIAFTITGSTQEVGFIKLPHQWLD